MLSDEERKRYSRHLSLEGFNEEDQYALKNATVLIVGAGALGSVVAGYLSGCGVGRITIMDYDTVDLSNLHRQIFYDTEILGSSKAERLSVHLEKLNPNCNIDVHQSMFRDNDETRYLIDNCDLIVECTDNPPTKLLVEKMGREFGKPVIIGGVSGWTGQVLTSMPDHSGFRDIFGDAPGCNMFTPCSQSGVIGPVPGIIASIQAVEAIKIITGKGAPLVDRVLIFSSFSMEFKVWKIR